MISLSIFLTVFIPVFIVVIYPGPCMLSYANIAMNYGYKKGYAGVFGCYTIEIIYWLIGVFALGTAQSFLPDVLIKILGLFAGLFLLYIAFDFYKTDTSKLHIRDIKNNSRVIYLKFLLLTLSNPIAIVGYASIYIGVNDVANNITTILISSALASISAHSVVVLLASSIGKIILQRKQKGEKIMRVINIVSAVCIAFYAIVKILAPTIKSFF